MAGRIGVVGLGAMGQGIAQNLLKAGISVQGCDVSAARRDEFVAAGGVAAATPAEAADGAEVLVVMVVDDKQGEEVLFGKDGAADAMNLGATVLLQSTLPPAFVADVATRLEVSGLLMVDAPVTGGKQGAADGTLTAMAAGSDAAMDAAMPLLEATCAHVFRVGDRCGEGAGVKMVHQLFVGIHECVMSEALTLAACCGVDRQTVFDVVSNGTGNSRIFENTAPDIVAGTYDGRGRVRNLIKDLAIGLETAKEKRCPAPLTAVAFQQFLAAEAGAARGTDADDAAVIRVYEALAGVTVAQNDR